MKPRFLFALLAPFVLAACAGTPAPERRLAVHCDMAHPGATVDTAAAVAMISRYRISNGLPPVRLDPALMRMARSQAQAMAARGELEHDVAGSFESRLTASGFDAARAAENIGAGYCTLGKAFAGWRASPPHNANMLLAGATRMGIAMAYAPNSKYQVFWSLELAQPDKKG